MDPSEKFVSPKLNNDKEDNDTIKATFAKLLSGAFLFVKKTYKKAFDLLYPICYIIGVSIAKLFKKASAITLAFLKKAKVLLLGLLASVAALLFVKPAKKAKAEALRIKEGFKIAFKRVETSSKLGFKETLMTVIKLPVYAFRRHFGLVSGIGRLSISAVAVMVMVFTVQFWSGGKTFALAVEYDGENLGYISQESVFDTAADMASEKVINADNSFSVTRTPKLTLTIINSSEISNETDICERIIRSSSDSIAQLSGVYIEGEFVGAVQSRKALELLIKQGLDKAVEKETDEVKYLENIEIIDGLYPVSNLKRIAFDYENAGRTALTGDTMNDILSTKLNIEVIREIEYSEIVEFQSRVVETDDLYIGESQIESEGQNGELHYTAELKFLNGEQVSNEVTSVTTVKEVVDYVVLEGTKTVAQAAPSYDGDGVAVGDLVWPLPSCRVISSEFGPRWGSFHTGMDISGGVVEGKPVIAADGGTVVSVSYGWNGGYGLAVIIDHGNGMETHYAHLSSIDVQEGQSVSRGQMVGRAGDTGYSIGAHLHFEVIINGSYVNPASYFE